MEFNLDYLKPLVIALLVASALFPILGLSDHVILRKIVDQISDGIRDLLDLLRGN